MTAAENSRVALYARYSSDLQSNHSIEDQIRLCSEYALSKDWVVGIRFFDAGMSGASMTRPGIQSLLTAATNGEFDILLAEALDRISRDQADIAEIYKRLEFAGVRIVTLSEGEISTLHIGLKGTMNAMFLKDLADKTRRGLRGRVESGKSGGGLAYGYNVVRQFTPQGEAIRGDRAIDPDRAQIVLRIFKEYARQNRSAMTIAHGLNEDGIAGPTGKAWSPSTISGNRRRGTGILNNHLYIGELIWNRQRFIKDPSTGRRVSRYNAEIEWIRKDVPELRIVPQEFWNATKARQKKLDKLHGNRGNCKRPKYLLSGLIKCAACGGGFSKISITHYGCSTYKNKGKSVCANGKTISCKRLENAVLKPLETHLLCDDLINAYNETYTEHMNGLQRTHSSTLNTHKLEEKKLIKERRNILQSIREGIPISLIKDDLEEVSARLKELNKLVVAATQDVRSVVHPANTGQYRRKVAKLSKYLNRRESLAEAAEKLHCLVEKIVLTPDEDCENLQIDLHGGLADILYFASKRGQLRKAALDFRSQ